MNNNMNNNNNYNFPKAPTVCLNDIIQLVVLPPTPRPPTPHRFTATATPGRSEQDTEDEATEEVLSTVTSSNLKKQSRTMEAMKTALDSFGVFGEHRVNMMEELFRRE